MPQVEILEPEEEETKLDDLGFYSKEKAVRGKLQADDKLYQTVVEVAVNSPRAKALLTLTKGRSNVKTVGMR